MIVIVDYRLGNPGSVFNMLKYLGIDAEITSDQDKIRNADKLILSGVGSFDTGVQNLKVMGLTDILNKKVLDEKTPVLGICLGMQLMGTRSDEGRSNGLGWINAETVKFTDKNYRIPHMMWNDVKILKESSLFNGSGLNPKFYFAHSYYIKMESLENVVATTSYGIEFVSVIEKNNIMGVQFHPEKSHRFGMELLKNFSEKY